MCRIVHAVSLGAVGHPVSTNYNMGFGEKIVCFTHKLVAVIPRLDRGITVADESYSSTSYSVGEIDSSVSGSELMNAPIFNAASLNR